MEVQDQAACQQKACYRRHEFYQYEATKKMCATMTTCSKDLWHKTAAEWKIFAKTATIATRAPKTASPTTEPPTTESPTTESPTESTEAPTACPCGTKCETKKFRGWCNARGKCK